MAEELQYTSKYDGVTTDELLAYAQEAKELLSNEYVRSMKEQVEAEDAETVQVYDVDGVPHKISKQELISKAGVQLPSLDQIGGFVAYDTDGQALGLMSKEQVAEVVGGLNGKDNGLGKEVKGDFNDVVQTGTYAINTDIYSNPNSPTTYGILEVENANNGRWIVQRVYSISYPDYYIRTRNDKSIWSKWSEINIVT